MMITKTCLKLLAVSVVFVAFQASATRADETADKIAELKKLREKIPTLHMVATSISRSGSGTRELRIESWEKNADGKHMYKRWVTAITEPGTPKEQAAAPILMIRDGVTAWRELDLGDKKLVFTGKSEMRNEYTDIEPLLSSGVARISNGGKLLDQPCVLLEIREKANPDDLIASYWISERHGIVLKSVVESTGATITEMKVAELEVDEAIPGSLFTYRPPADAQIIEDKSAKSGKTD